MNSQENLELMERRHNSSKGARSEPQWRETPMGREVSEGYMQHIRAKQIALARAMAKILGGVEYLPKAFKDLLEE